MSWWGFVALPLASLIPAALIVLADFGITRAEIRQSQKESK